MQLKSYPRIYFKMLIIGFLLILGLSLSKVFLPIMARSLDPTGILVGFVTSAWFFARTFIELPSGIMSIRMGRIRLINAGLILAFIGSLICAFSNSIYLLILGMVLWGFGSALFFTSNTSLLFDLFKPERRGRAIGTFQSIEFIGSFIGAPLGGVLATYMGFNHVFLVITAFLVVSFIIAFTSKEFKKTDIAVIEDSPTPTFKDVLVGIRNFSLIVVCFINLSRMLVTQGVMSTVFQLYLNEFLCMDVEIIGVVMGIRTGGLICAVLLSGYLSDRFGRKPLIIVGLLISAVSMYSYSLAYLFQEFVIIALLDGIGSGLIFTSLIVLMAEVVHPSVRGGAIGLYRTFMDVGGVLGPIIFMFMYDMHTQSPFWAASILLLLNLALALSIKSRVESDKGL